MDAPSSTALSCSARQSPPDAALHLAENSRTRHATGIPASRVQGGTIGFATLRGGSVIGEHFGGSSPARANWVTPVHSAGDRSIFARGAAKSALWARDKKPGLYSMLDVLGLFDVDIPCEPRSLDHQMSGTLVLVRHGQSEWNLKNLFTGWP